MALAALGNLRLVSYMVKQSTHEIGSGSRSGAAAFPRPAVSGREGSDSEASAAAIGIVMALARRGCSAPCCSA